jgi:predicted TIM-barrel enzyme
MLKAEGVQEGCGTEAVAYRSKLAAGEIAILADVYDRTGHPLVPVPLAQAAQWAVRVGANGLILTGDSYEESKRYLKTVRESGIACPLLLGGGANVENVSEVLGYANGVIVSTALMRDSVPRGDLVQWDYDKCARFMERAISSILLMGDREIENSPR